MSVLIIIGMDNANDKVDYSQSLQYKKEIAKAAEDAVKVISEATTAASVKMASDAASAVKVVSDAAAVSAKVLNEKSSGDHDLLIELKTRMGDLKEDIKELSSGITSKILSLEQNKADRKEFELLRTEVDNIRETRIRPLENRVSTFLITMGIFTVASGSMIALILFHVFQK